MLVERRSVFLFFVLTSLAAGALAIGCSDSNPPAGSGGGGGSTLVTVDGGNGSSKTDAAADAGDGGTEPPPTPCLDDTSETLDGGAGPTSCASLTACSALCTRLGARFKLGVAQVAIFCIEQLGACTENGATICVQQALGRACRDTTSASYCSAFVTTCDPNAGGPGSNISENECETVASSLSPAGRAQFSSCVQDKITAGTCADQVLTCYRNLYE